MYISKRGKFNASAINDTWNQIGDILVGEEVKGVGVMKDEDLKIEEIEVSHTLGGYRRCSFVYYESMKRELKIRPIYECRCDERLKTKTEEST